MEFEFVVVTWSRMAYLFICGCPRSGTTALMEVLNLDERIAIGKERFKHRPRVSQELFEPSYFLKPDPEETNLLDETFYAALEPRVRSGSLAFIGDKVPGYFRRLDSLRRDFPDAKMFMLIRDPVRVACSFKRRSQRPSDGWSEEKDFRDAIRQWNESLQRAHRFISAHGVESLFLAKYEWLFCGDERYLRAVFGFLGLELPGTVRSQFRELTADWPRRQRRRLSLTNDELLEVRRSQDLELAGWADRVAARQLAILLPEGHVFGVPDPPCRTARNEQSELMLGTVRRLESDRPASAGASDVVVQGAQRLREELERLASDLREYEASLTWRGATALRKLTRLFGSAAEYSEVRPANRVDAVLERARLHEQSVIEGQTRSIAQDGVETFRFCPVCGCESPGFLPFGKNRRPDAKCPRCGSLERHRFLYLLLERETELLSGERPLSVLHVGAEKVVASALGSLEHLEYRPLGQAGSWDGVVDSLDAVDASSVDVVLTTVDLERVESDGAVLRSMLRVLKPGGVAVVQAQVRGRHTMHLEDDRLKEARRNALAQSGRYRVYGSDLLERLAREGLAAHVRRVDDVASAEERRRMALGGRTFVVGRRLGS